MAEAWMTLDAATKALAATADRAALLMRDDSERARQEASRAWDQIELMRSDINEARKETQKVRAGGRRAWFTVGFMAAVMIVTTGYTSSALTRHHVETRQLSNQIDQWRVTAEHRQVELQQLREQTQRALVAQARAEAQLNTINPHQASKQTLSERVAKLFIDTNQ
jgi:hypothetical protein